MKTRLFLFFILFIALFCFADDVYHSNIEHFQKDVHFTSSNRPTWIKDGIEVGLATTNDVTGGGSGGWIPENRIVTGEISTVSTNDYLIWMDGNAALTNQILILPNLDVDYQTIVVRQLGDYRTSITRGTNVFFINGNGDWVIFDWLGPQTNWYWRQ